MNKIYDTLLSKHGNLINKIYTKRETIVGMVGSVQQTVSSHYYLKEEAIQEMNSLVSILEPMKNNSYHSLDEFYSDLNHNLNLKLFDAEDIRLLFSLTFSSSLRLNTNKIEVFPHLLYTYLQNEFPPHI